MFEIEVWKDVVDFEGLYQVSSLGRVKSLSRIARHWLGGLSKYPEKILTGRTSKKYVSVVLYKNLKTKSLMVHRLVAIAFIPNPKNLSEVNHKDGDKENNNKSNLGWVTPSENVRHAFATGLTQSTRGESVPNAKLTDAVVLDIKLQHSLGTLDKKIYMQKYNIVASTIDNVLSGRTWRHVQLSNNLK